MNRHLGQEIIAAFRSRQLPPGKLVPALQHIADCEECRRRTQSSEDEVRLVEAALQQPDDERHLDAETELFPYVDGTADAATRELIGLHLEDCDLCRREAEELFALRRQLERVRRPRRWRVLAIAASAVLALVAAMALVLWRMRPQEAPSPPVVESPSPERRAPAPPQLTTGEHPRYRDAKWEGLVRETLARGSLPVAPIVAAVAQPAHTMRGPRSASGAGLVPAGVVIESDRPTFSWHPIEGATYIVTIYDGDAEIANSGAMERASWTPPRALRRGRTYVWQVKARRGEEIAILPSPPAAPALFHVISDAAARELASARAAHPDDHLLLAVLSAQHGLVADAQRHLRHLPPEISLRIDGNPAVR
jgi:hypothetical protein